MTPSELPVQWRKHAELVEHCGDSTIAKALRTCADDLDASLRSLEDDALNLATASKVSGYSTDRLRHMVAAGAIPNAGRKGSPRIRRGDLPKKQKAGNGFDAAAAAQNLLSR